MTDTEGLREAPEKLLARLGFHFLGDCDCVTKAECYERTLQIVNEWAALAAPAPKLAPPQLNAMELLDEVRQQVKKYQWDSGEDFQEATTIANDIIALVRRAAERSSK